MKNEIRIAELKSCMEFLNSLFKGKTILNDSVQSLPMKYKWNAKEGKLLWTNVYGVQGDLSEISWEEPGRWIADLPNGVMRYWEEYKEGVREALNTWWDKIPRKWKKSPHMRQRRLIKSARLLDALFQC